MRLAELIDAVPPRQGDIRVERVIADSRSAGPGALFVARRGTAVDGHAFIAEAARRGCAAVVGGDELPGDVAALLRERGVPYVAVENPARTLGELASRIEGHPSRSLTVVGITGTNGKTTVATLLHQLFAALGESTGLIATTGVFIGGKRRPNDHTTPPAVELQGHLAAMVRAGCRFCFMEVTSHAIDQERIAGIDFDGGIFTNLDHEHLDYHGTLKAYARVKQRFLGALPPSAFALANADDERGRFMVATTQARVAFYGSTGEALLPWSLERCDERGMIVRIGTHRVRTPLLGEHNASNLAAVFTAASLVGRDPADLVAAIPGLLGARGRMQRVVCGPVLGIVDYAHTPGSLARVIASVQRLRPGGKLIVVAGCGGDRDQSKRAAMGGALARADSAIFTSDNPRSEEPEAIVAAMLAGVLPTRRRHVQVELDRRRAIERAAGLAEAGDVVLLLGKGHETVQEIGVTKHPWDDASRLRAALRRRAQSAPAIGARVR